MGVSNSQEPLQAPSRCSEVPAVLGSLNNKGYLIRCKKTLNKVNHFRSSGFRMYQEVLGILTRVERVLEYVCGVSPILRAFQRFLRRFSGLFLWSFSKFKGSILGFISGVKKIPLGRIKRFQTL